MSKPILSIIVPIYNVEDYLERCIKSILNQTFSDFELILVDDGSTDSSPKICNEFKVKDKRVQVINKKKGGVSSARNEGIKIAKGEYIGFVDSDDFINKNMYKILYENAKQYDADISICSFEYVSYNTSLRDDNVKINNSVIIYNNIESLEKLYGDESIKFIVPWNKVYRRSLFFDIRYDVGKTNEDEFIIHKLFYKSNKVVSCSKKLYYYFENDKSIMRKKFNVNRIDVIEAMEKRMSFFREKALTELEYKTQNMFLYYFFPYYYKAKFELKDSNCLKKMKKQFKRNYKYLLKNPNYNLKAKVLWLTFIVNPFVFYLIWNKRSK